MDDDMALGPMSPDHAQFAPAGGAGGGLPNRIGGVGMSIPTQKAGTPDEFGLRRLEGFDRGMSIDGGNSSM
jgi:hypothetical protein